MYSMHLSRLNNTQVETRLHTTQAGPSPPLYETTQKWIHKVINLVKSSNHKGITEEENNGYVSLNLI